MEEKKKYVTRNLLIKKAREPFALVDGQNSY